MVKVGVMGLGFMGVTHLKAYLQNPRARLVAVADVVKERLTGDLSGVQGNIHQGGARFDFSGVKTYAAPLELLDDPDVELVSLCLPTPLHAEYTREALARGKHVLCEKPMALSSEDLDSMLDAAGSSSARLMVAQCIRFWPDYRKAREVAGGGALGKILSAHFSRRSALPSWGGWLGDETKSGGPIIDLSVHDIDFACHLAGPPRMVRAVGARNPTSELVHFHGTMFCGETPVTIDGGWYLRGQYPFSMAFDIYCEKGILSFDSSKDRRLTLFREDGTSERPELPAGDGYDGEIDYLMHCIEKGRRPDFCPPEESALAVKVALLLRESWSLGGNDVEVPASWL